MVAHGGAANGGASGGVSSGGGGATGNGGTGGTGTSGGAGGGTAGSASGGTGGASGGTGGNAGEAGAPAAEGGAAGAGPISDGTLLKYNFDEGTGTVVTDSSGRGLNGTASDAAVWSAAGRHGGALALNGGTPPTKFVSVPPGILKNVTNFSMTTWVKINTDPGWYRIFDFGGSGTGTDTRFMYLTPGSNQGLHFSIFGGAAAREAATVTNTHLPLAVWKHVAVTAQADGDNYIYVDGFPAGHSTGIIVPPSEMEPLSADSWLGKSRFAADGGFDGLMDDFVLYDHVLTRTEIADLAWPKSDYSDWRFDEASGTKAADSSDRAIDAAFAGTAQWTSGRLGAGVALDGTTAHVSLASNPLAGCTTEATIAIWVKLGAAAQWARVFDFGTANGDATDRWMFLAPRNGTNALQFSLHTPTADMDLISNTTVPTDSAWHHLAVVMSPAAATVYMDGVSVANTATPLAPSELGAATQNWLGRSRFGTDAYLTGSLDELRISCRAYTADEIVNLAFK